MEIKRVRYMDQLGGDVTAIDIELQDGTFIRITGVGFPDAVFTFAGDPEGGGYSDRQSFFHDDILR
jgi:hypothetical protein